MKAVNGMLNANQNGFTVADKSRLRLRLSKLIFTDDFKQGRRVAIVLMTAAVYAVCAALLYFGAAKGMFDPMAKALAAVALTVATVFFLIIRSGFNLRFEHPSLALPQALCAQFVVVAGYAVLGAAHSAALALLAMVMVFGMFEMDTKRVWILLGCTLCLTVAIMLYCVAINPSVYDYRVELVHFIVMAAVLTSIASLSIQLGNLRQRMRRQKVELESAMEQLRNVATHDELTGLPNRRQMLTLLAEHIARHTRGGASFSIALADLDHFKTVNDQFGHRVGDDALRCFARQARTHLRSTDIAGRWGGEEFLLLLPESRAGDPNIGIERLRGALTVAQINPQAPHLRIAFSTGMTSYIDGESVDDLVERADKALYLAKSGGRNQTKIISGEQKV
ncbi:diguanylate cyclase [Massilia sp. CF038]|uniref:GGDEF domain-containing protein n=1 Tax=Massilia sp. CF038 TaxID=1881045 RepID=UPI000913115F|nr:diguanylate cyclase [Massilia sp. CF038]SHH09777.1 diguanylate cyclase (GGDEF) domain-containing protein [Massilia sp. CF038]